MPEVERRPAPKGKPPYYRLFRASKDAYTPKNNLAICPVCSLSYSADLSEVPFHSGDHHFPCKGSGTPTSI